MSSIAERINYILDSEGIKKSEFAQKLGITSSSVSTMCSGKSKPSNQTIVAICREFSISEQWLRTGEGPMKIQMSDDVDFIRIMTEIQFSDDPFIRDVLKAYWDLDQSKKQVIWELMDNFIKARKGRE